LTKQAEKAAMRFVRSFVATIGPALFDAAMQAEDYGSHPDAGSPEGAFGHDLWLTCAGHGAGFWDRDELTKHTPACGGHESIGYALTAACQKVPYRGVEFDAYRGWVYLHWFEWHPS
jgi:hypothetical protein